MPQNPSFPPGFVPDGFEPDGPPNPTSQSSGDMSLGQKLALAMRTTPLAGLPENLIGRWASNQVADVVEDPVGAIPTVAAQVGAMGGTAVGGPLGGVAGAGAFGAGGRAIQNMIRARPVSEGVMTEGAAQGAIQAVPQLGRPLKTAGKWVYTKALKPTMTDMAHMAENSAMLPDQMRSYLADVGLKHNVSVSNKGLHQAEAAKDVLDNQIQSKLAASPAQIDMNAVRSDATSGFRKNFGTQNIPQDDAAVFDAAMTKFGENPMLQKPQMQATGQAERMFQGMRGEQAPMFASKGQRFAARQPVAKVNEIRRGSNKKVRDQYGELGRSGVEAEKAISRAESQAVKAAVPETAPLFKEQHDLINLQKVLTRTTTNAANAQPIRLYEMLGALSGNPAAVGLGTFSRPSVQGWVGRNAYNAGNSIMGLPPEYVRAALLALMQGEQEPGNGRGTR